MSDPKQEAAANLAATQMLDLLRTSGILNPNVTLDQLLNLTQKVEALGEAQGGTVNALLIHSRFVLWHN